jgi:hypothetical protein
MFGDRPKSHEVVLLNVVGLLVDVFLVIFVVVVIIIIPNHLGCRLQVQELEQLVQAMLRSMT